MQLDRISYQYPDGTTAGYDFHPRLTVIDTHPAHRRSLAEHLLQSLWTDAAGVHVEFTGTDGAAFVAFRPYGSTPRVIGVDRPVDVTDRYLRAGRVNLLAPLAIEPETALDLLLASHGDLVLADPTARWTSRLIDGGIEHVLDAAVDQPACPPRGRVREHEVAVAGEQEVECGLRFDGEWSKEVHPARSEVTVRDIDGTVDADDAGGAAVGPERNESCPVCAGELHVHAGGVCPQRLQEVLSERSTMSGMGVDDRQSGMEVVSRRRTIRVLIGDTVELHVGPVSSWRSGECPADHRTRPSEGIGSAELGLWTTAR